jgi:hypothetical protein
MYSEQLIWKQEQWSGMPSVEYKGKIQLVLAFGGIDVVGNPERYNEIKSFYPKAEIVMVSTAGEIYGRQVSDNTICISACYFESTKIKVVKIQHHDFDDSSLCGKDIVERLNQKDLKHVLIFSDGIHVNGDDLIKGMNEHITPGAVITGGLAADSGRFKETLVGLNEAPLSGGIVAIGFYGEKIMIGHGSKGGWQAFGPLRTVTRSEKNVLYELDGENALQLYKRYLGEEAANLPKSALKFPLSVSNENGNGQVVRTILGIDEEKGAMIFAGNLIEGSKVQLMMASYDRLIDGAFAAAEDSFKSNRTKRPELILMISCVGRKVVLEHRVKEEVASVTDLFGEKSMYIGFYSNGEISPQLNSVGCSLHNQTMTITTFTEAA